jgi:hypothetical protein
MPLSVAYDRVVFHCRRARETAETRAAQRAAAAPPGPRAEEHCHYCGTDDMGPSGFWDHRGVPARNDNKHWRYCVIKRRSSPLRSDHTRVRLTAQGAL